MPTFFSSLMALQLQVMITTKYRATSDDKVDIMTNLRFQCLFDANFVVPGGTGFLSGLWTENREWYHDHCRFSIFVCSMAEMHLAYKSVWKSGDLYGREPLLEAEHVADDFGIIVPELGITHGTPHAVMEDLQTTFPGVRAVHQTDVQTD